VAGEQAAEAARAAMLKVEGERPAAAAPTTAGADGPAPDSGAQPLSAADGLKAADRAAFDPAAQAARPSQAPQSPAEQVAVQIQRAAAGGADRINIQLQPEELGRVEIRLEIGDDQRTRAAVLVDRPETLDLLQRDARALERALNQAGLKTDGGSLSFNLRGDGHGGAQHQGGGRADGQAGSQAGPGDLPGDALDIPTSTASYTARIGADRLDIRI
jgi:flagellar hook-length control protein FliK